MVENPQDRNSDGATPGSSLVERLAADVAPASTEHDRHQLWILDAVALVDDHGRVVVVLSGGVGTTPDLVKRLSARFPLAGVETIGIDAHGGVRLLREKQRPSSVGPHLSPPQIDRELGVLSGLRLSKIIVWESEVQRASVPETETMGLEEILPILVSKSRALDTIRQPLRTLSSLLEASGGALRHRGQDIDAVSALVATHWESHRISVAASALRRAKPSKTQEGSPTGSLLFRGPSLDEIAVSGGRLAILQRTELGEKLSILDSAASAVWDAATGLPRQDLCAAVPAIRGAGTQLERVALAEKAIDEMVRDGLLRNEPSWRVSDSAAWTTSSARTTVLNLDDPLSHPMILEETANAIWTSLAARTVCAQGEIIAECGRLFEIDTEFITADVVGLLRRLSAEGVIDRL